MSASEEMIRQRAYELWDQAGRPNGRSDEFWFSAKAEFESKVRTGISEHAYTPACGAASS